MDENDKLTLPDGTQMERFIVDGNVKRELVLVAANNPQGCRLTYRDAMTPEDVEFGTTKLAAADEPVPEASTESTAKPRKRRST